MTQPGSSSGAFGNRLQAVLLLALTGLTLAVFGGAWDHQFVHYDDAANIYRNPHLQGLGWETIKWMFTDTTYARRYMPLGWLSYAIDYQLFGLNPRAYHVGNIFVHTVNVVLLFLLLKRLLEAGRSSAESKADRSALTWCAALGTLFWAVHPLRVESVAWASSRIYGVVCFFTLLWLLAWLRARDPETSAARKRFCYWLSLACYAASLLTYPLMIFAPVALFALELLPGGIRVRHWADLRRPEWLIRLWRDKIPFLVVAAAALALTFAARVVTGTAYRPPTLAEFGLGARAMQAFYIWAYYAWKPWMPYDLSATYSTLHSFNPLDGKFLVSAFLVLTVSGALALRRKKWPVVLALWLCHLAVLVPALGLTEYPHSAYDRYSYLQGILWSVALALWLRRNWIYASRAPWGAVVVGAVSLLFALRAWQQVPVWRDTITLYRHMVSHLGEHPNRSRFDEVLGVHYLRAGLTNEAIASFQNALHYEAIRADRNIYDEGVLARVNLRVGDLLSDQDQAEEALVYFQASLKAKPQSREALAKIRACLTRLHRETEAMAN